MLKKQKNLLYVLKLGVALYNEVGEKTSHPLLPEMEYMSSSESEKLQHSLTLVHAFGFGQYTQMWYATLNSMVKVPVKAVR